MKTYTLREHLINSAKDLLRVGFITDEKCEELISGIEREDKPVYRKVTELLQEYADTFGDQREF